MRKLILAISLLAISAGTAFAYNDPSINGWENKSRYAQQGGDGNQVTVLKLMRNAEEDNNTAGISSQDAVVYDTVSDDGVTCDLTTTSADGAFAGIAVTTIPTSDSTGTSSANQDMGKRNWGWVLVHGKVVAKTGTGGTNGNSVGDFVITSTDSGSVTTIPGSATATTTRNGLMRAVSGRGGFFLDAADPTATSAEVFIDKE